MFNSKSSLIVRHVQVLSKARLLFQCLYLFFFTRPNLVHSLEVDLPVHQRAHDSPRPPKDLPHNEESRTMSYCHTRNRCC